MTNYIADIRWENEQSVSAGLEWYRLRATISVPDGDPASLDAGDVMSAAAEAIRRVYGGGGIQEGVAVHGVDIISLVDTPLATFGETVRP